MQTSKHSKGPDNFWFKIILITIVIIWIALACGNLLGHYFVKKKFFSKSSVSAIRDVSNHLPLEIYAPPELETYPSPSIMTSREITEEIYEVDKTTSPKPEKTKETVDQYTLQMGAFSNYKNAKNLIDQLAQLKIKASVKKIKTDGQVLYKVLTGSYITRQEAVKKAEQLKSKGLSPIVVSRKK